MKRWKRVLHERINSLPLPGKIFGVYILFSDFGIFLDVEGILLYNGIREEVGAYDRTYGIYGHAEEMAR